MTADRVSSLPIFLFSSFFLFCGNFSKFVHPRSFFITLTPLSRSHLPLLLLLRDTLASPFRPLAPHTHRIMSSKNDIRMSTGSSGDEDRKLEGGESTVNGASPSAAAAAVPSTTTSKADLHPAFYIAYGNDRFITYWGGFGWGWGKMESFFWEFFVFLLIG